LLGKEWRWRLLCASLGWKNPRAHAVAVKFPIALQGAGATWDMDVEQEDALCVDGYCSMPNYLLLFQSKGPPGIKGEKGDTGSPGMQVMVDTIPFICYQDLPIFPSNYFKKD